MLCFYACHSYFIKNVSYLLTLKSSMNHRSLGEQGNMNLFLGNRGTNLYKLEDENILI